MGELTVTGLDEPVLARLSRQAAEHGLSLEVEARQLVEASVSPGQDTLILAMLAEARRQSAGSIRSDTLELIREGRDELA